MSQLDVAFRALQEAQDTFGLEFDFDEFEKFGQGDFEEDEEDYEEEDEERIAMKKVRNTKCFF